MTFFVSAYDTEFIRDPNHSLKAVETITEIHRGHDAPATFFIVGRLLEKAGERFRALLEEELFDVQSHTYTHSGLTNPWMPPEPEPWMPFGLSVREEVEGSVRLILKYFDRTPVGLRPAGGHYRGFRGRPDILKVMWENGIKFLSSELRGPGEYIPYFPFTQPYWYKDDGYPDLLELPGHDWHDPAIVGLTPPRLVPWPPVFPWGYPSRLPKNAREEFEVYKPAMDYSVDNKLFYYSPVLHPWSIYMFDKKCEIVDLILSHAKRRDMRITSYYDIWKSMAQKQ